MTEIKKNQNAKSMSRQFTQSRMIEAGETNKAEIAFSDWCRRNNQPESFVQDYVYIGKMEGKDYVRYTFKKTEDTLNEDGQPEVTLLYVSGKKK